MCELGSRARGSLKGQEKRGVEVGRVRIERLGTANKLNRTADHRWNGAA